MNRLCKSHLLSVLAVLFIAAWARADEPADQRPDCFVLSVGIDDYPKGKLKGCVNDARNIVSQFENQQEKVFGKVFSQTLLDGEAKRDKLVHELAQLRDLGKAGDFVVVFLSGHGGRRPGTNAWFFLPCDYHSPNHDATGLSDRQLLDAAKEMVDQGKKVLLIIDACFAGQVRLAARDYLDQARNPNGGGLILILSSMPSQTSAALGQYRAYAKAVVDALAGEADIDGDGFVTLREIRRYAYARTYQLCRQHGIAREQDGDCDWSLSITENLRLAAVSRPSQRQGNDDLKGAVSRPSEWQGSENLDGFGRLTFRIYEGGRVTMIDARQTVEGTWQQQGQEMILRFSGGRIVYTGTIDNGVMSGTARTERASWSWSVRSAAAEASNSQPE